MTKKPEFNEGWGPALEGEKWKRYKEKEFQHLNYHQKFLSIYSSLNRSDLSPELKSLIDAANGTIETGRELLSHMSFERAEREKPRKDGAESTKQNKIKWEAFICQSVKKYTDDKSRVVDTDLEFFVVGEMRDAEREGEIKNSKGQAIKAPIKSVKRKIKLACKQLRIDDPYPTRKKTMK
jgi:hypothetical protein